MLVRANPTNPEHRNRCRLRDALVVYWRSIGISIRRLKAMVRRTCGAWAKPTTQYRERSLVEIFFTGGACGVKWHLVRSVYKHAVASPHCPRGFTPPDAWPGPHPARRRRKPNA